MTNKEHIDAIVNDTFNILKEVYKHQKEPKSTEDIEPHLEFPYKN